METYLIRITDYLLTQSWQIAVLVAVIAAVSLALKNRSAHIRYLLWLIVLAKCLMPPLFTVPLAILPQEESAGPVSISPPTEMPAADFAVANTTITEPVELPPAPVEISPAPMVEEGRPRIAPREWLGVAWIAGAIAFLAFNLLKALRASLWLWRQRKPLPAELRSDIENLFSAHGIKRFSNLWLVDGMSQPFVWGLLRGSIYLPIDFLTINKPEHQRNVLGHELSHVVRLDAAVNVLQVLAQAIFWFHPFVWWANKKMRGEREKCCDEMAIARLSTLPRDYSTAILETLAARHEQGRPVPSLAVAGPVKNIEERIRTMLRPGKKFYKRPSLVAATVVLVLALLAVPTAPVLTARASENREGKVLACDEFDGKLNLEWEILNPDTSHYSLSKNPGALTITTQDGTFCRGRTDYKNLFLIDCPTAPGEDFQLTTCISSFKPVAAFNQAGLICWNDVDNSLKLDYEWCLEVSSLDIEAQRVFTVGTEIEEGGQEVFRAAWCPANQQLQRVWLRVTKQGNKYTFTTSVDGKSFAPLGPPLLDQQGLLDDGVRWGDGTVKRVGLFAINGSRDGMPEIDASFDFFEVKALATDRAGSIEPTKSLTHAVAAGDIQQVKLHISKGTDVNEKTSTGDTALHYAARHGHKGAAEVLVAAGADVNAKNQNGETPAHIALMTGEPVDPNQKEVLDLLIAKGADISCIQLFAFQGNLAKVKSFVEDGTDVDSRDFAGRTALHYAATQGNQNVVEFLVTKGADVNSRDKDAFIPLHWAGEYLNIVELFISKGANVNARDKWGWTPLDGAAWNGRTEEAELLIKAGAKIDSRYAWGETPLIWAAQAGHTAVAQLLMAKGANVNAKDNNGQTPLMHAARRGHEEVVKLLITKGADINAEAYFSRGTTALGYAAGSGHMGVVKVLLAKGADVNAGGRTPLHGAASSGHKDIVNFLITNGADVNAKDNEGRSPLWWAKSSGHSEIVGLLRKDGAKK